MSYPYRNHRSQWLKESLELHHATSIEISKQLNLSRAYSDLHQKRAMQAFKTIEDLDSFLVVHQNTQAHCPKSYQILFQNLNTLYFDHLLT